jgi:glycine/D-amino acid oxidase-like deaminating enzyme
MSATESSVTKQAPCIDKESRANGVTGPHIAKSFWLFDQPEYTPEPALMGDRKCDVVVIGGGLAGTSAAWHVAKDSPALDVVLIESEIVGYGASGRNAGWVMPELGPDEMVVKKKYGEGPAREMALYGKRAAAYVAELVERHQIDSEYRQVGALNVAFDDRWVDNHRKLFEHFQAMGRTETQWLEGEKLQAEFAGQEHFKAAILTPDVGLVHPVKHVRALKQLCLDAGVKVYENTPSIHISQTARGVRVITPSGIIEANRAVLTTNAFTNMLRGPVGDKLRRDQGPTIARASVTEKLSPEQWEAIGWHRRCGIQSSLVLMHVLTPLSDGRILFNYAYHSGHPRSGEMEPVTSADAAYDSLDQLKRIFPVLKDVRIEHHWGGHASTTFDMVPHLGWVDDKKRVVYLTGCWAHGVAANHLHGQTIADLVLDKQTDLSESWFVTRAKKNWPIAPIDHWGKALVWEGYRRKSRKLIKGTIFA